MINEIYPNKLIYFEFKFFVLYIIFNYYLIYWPNVKSTPPRKLKKAHPGVYADRRQN